MRHPWVTRRGSDDQQGLLFPCWKSSCCPQPLTDHWGLLRDLSYHLTDLDHQVGPSVFPSTFPWSILAFWHMFWTGETGCSFSVTYGPPVLTLFSPTKIKYMKIELNLSWKPFYQPGHLPLNPMRSQTSSRWDPGLTLTESFTLWRGAHRDAHREPKGR